MATRDILDKDGNVIGQLTLPDETSEDEWTERLAPFSREIPGPTLNEILTAKIKGAENFAAQLMLEAVVENLAMGITQAGKTRAVADYCRQLQRYLATGSLYAAIEQIDDLIETGVPVELDPFVTEQRLTDIKNKILMYIGG